MSIISRKILLLFSLCFLLPSLVFGQGLTTAAMNGVVTDKNGNPLVGATVIALHVPSGTQFGNTTRVDGKFNLQNLRVGGPYTVKVTYVGYQAQTQEGINLALGQNLKIDFTLPEEQVQLSGVTIVAEKSSVLSQGRTGAAQNVSLSQIEALPSTGRGFQNFAKLSPLFSGTNLQAAGRKSSYNNIQIDGTQYNDLFGLGSTGTPGGQSSTNPISLDAIREFQVNVAPYDVKMSGFTGGGINAITRSGANKYSGSVYFYGRNQGFVGKNPNTGASDYPDFKDYQYGFRVGGPIMQDKLFFFVNGELAGNSQPQPQTALLAGFGGKTVAELMDYANRMKSALAAKGMSSGSYDPVTFEQPSTKLFFRFDYNLAANHQLTLHYNLVDASKDLYYNSKSSSTLLFDTQPYQMKNTTNNIVAQLNSTFGNNMSNELIAGLTSIRDKRHGKSADAPEVRISELNGTFYMYAGPDRYSGANSLDQDIFEITDNFSYYVGDHTFTLGTHNEFFSFKNLFVRSAFGYYNYTSIDNFINNIPSYYQHVYSRVPDPAAKFSVAQYGFYVQDEWLVLPQLKVNIGVRMDIPTFPDKPAQNDSVSKYFPGHSTTDIPSGNILWSPRIGVNWDVLGDRTTQVRGGAGIFTGRVPYVWLSNDFGNTGTTLAEVSFSNTANTKVLNFVADPNNQYLAGDSRDENKVLGAANLKSEIDLADKNLKLPQVLRFNAAVDQQLPEDIVGTVEFMYSKTLNDMVYRKLNIKPATAYNPIDGRPIYGGTDSKNNNFLDVLELYNTSKGYQWDLVFQVQRNVPRGISFNAGYKMERAKDLNSVNSSQAASQMNYNGVEGDPNNPKLTTSVYEIPSRIFASVTYTEEFFENAPTTISLFYNGQSGTPYSWTVSGDVNNDGFTYNDLFYIPRNKDEILLGSIDNTTKEFVPSTKAGTTYDDLNSFIENNDYLKEHRGQIAERYASKEPWNNYLDMKVTQDVPDFLGMGHFQISLDILNVLNLMNKEWGRIEYYPYSFYVVTYKGKVTYNGVPNTPVYSFSKPANNKPFSYSDLASRWQMQLGIRYSF
jgi:hypothetical protein